MIDDERVIVSAEYGSRAVGVATGDSDRDLMSVFLEPPRFVTGIDAIDTVTGGTAAVGERSTRNDTDTVSYPLRKWARLAAIGNPTVLFLLFVPCHEVMTSEWGRILDVRDAFLSRDAGRRFAGYSWGQREALLGLRNKRTNRPELVHRHGYDTKFAYHMIRTALQGIELMNTGALRLPMGPEEVALLRSIRRGALDKDDVIGLSNDLDAQLASAIGASALPENADRARINATLHGIHLDAWQVHV
ncbi:nucleotidyltransferase domain-containing protein [Herbiconiux ginsengi]|uniref:Predicted nucleotidyltransferase n=1 Tax=Herbiconiux ginsengi TaxID=381665 RepID=A0A1H3SDP0_9MICO|nr:nucleotidyltransferase domain-containing protein [Herbiconiux ginsengi]SDZ35209.1 Predicted nucleotidyltransferase [Herbiconiux ginsengi]